MKAKIYNTLLIISSLFGFLEWGQNKAMFLFQVEAELFLKIFKDPFSVLHPFVILPLLGQVFLLLTLFQKSPNKILTYIAIGCIGVLMALILFIGCINLNIKIISSTIPFFAIVFITIRYHSKRVID